MLQGVKAEVKAMKPQTDLSMNGGEGETSYANNSTIQMHIQQIMKPLVEGAILGTWERALLSGVGIADFGCASGPNALALVSTALDAVHRRCARLRAGSGELRVYLNDLPGNDFNTVFRHIPAFLTRLKDEKRDRFGPVFVAGVPGSFHGRLLPRRSLHLACSSFSLHWLSEVPRELMNNGSVGRKNPSVIFEAYARQFEKDFSLFLRSRAEEITGGGHLVISLQGRTCEDPFSKDCYRWDRTVNILNEMASKGIIDEERVNSFYMPVYQPYLQELKEIIEAEGSFEISHIRSHEVMRGGSDCLVATAKAHARGLRTVHESILVGHFGGQIMHKFMDAAEEYLVRVFRSPEYTQIALVASLKRRE